MLHGIKSKFIKRKTKIMHVRLDLKRSFTRVHGRKFNDGWDSMRDYVLSHEVEFGLMALWLATPKFSRDAGIDTTSVLKMLKGIAKERQRFKTEKNSD